MGVKGKGEYSHLIWKNAEDFALIFAPSHP